MILGIQVKVSLFRLLEGFHHTTRLTRNNIPRTQVPGFPSVSGYSGIDHVQSSCSHITQVQHTRSNLSCGPTSISHDIFHDAHHTRHFLASTNITKFETDDGFLQGSFLFGGHNFIAIAKGPISDDTNVQLIRHGGIDDTHEWFLIQTKTNGNAARRETAVN